MGTLTNTSVTGSKWRNYLSTGRQPTISASPPNTTHPQPEPQTTTSLLSTLYFNQTDPFLNLSVKASSTQVNQVPLESLSDQSFQPTTWITTSFLTLITLTTVTFGRAPVTVC